MGTILSTLHDFYTSLHSALTLLRALSASFDAALTRASQSPGLPNAKLTQTYWLQNPPFPDLINVSSPELRKTADVAIIGSGIAGAAIARSLLHERRRRNVDVDENVVVFEARQLCSGATARNGGHIKASPYEAFAQLSKNHTKDRAAALTRFRMRHVESILDVCRAEGIASAEAKEVETVDAFLDDASFRKAIQDVREMKEWIPEVEIVVSGSKEAQERFGLNDSVAGALCYTAGAIWAYRFVVSIWRGLQIEFAETLSIETNTPVESISVSKDGPAGFPYALKTPRGTIFARHVVHTTNGFASHLVPGLRRKIVGARAHMSAQRPGDSFPDSGGKRSWGVVYGGAFDYVTQRPGSGGDLMVGGGFMRSSKQGVDQVGLCDDSITLDPLTVSHIAGIMPAIFHPRWGAGAELKQVWSGILGMTGDFLPLVGRLPADLTGRDATNVESSSNGTRSNGDSWHGEWIAAGFSGEGMVWAWLCGAALGIMMVGSEEEDLSEVPGRPGGRLADWFPVELRVSSKRLRSADVANLANSI